MNSKYEHKGHNYYKYNQIPRKKEKVLNIDNIEVGGRKIVN